MASISIVIPCYNVAPYLREALDSVLNQTYVNWECLCIDDGSKDDSATILDHYARLDARFRIIHQPNVGVSQARHRGIVGIKGQWLAWVDSDDIVSSDYLSHLEETARKTNAEFVWADYYERLKSKDKYINQSCELTEEACTRAFITGELWGGVWGKLFSVARIRQYKLGFKNYDFSVHEDLCFVLSYLVTGATLAHCPHADYYYNLREGSLLRTREKPTVKALNASEKVQLELERILKEKDVKAVLYARREHIKFLAYTLKEIPSKRFNALFPEITKLHVEETSLAHKILFYLACRGCRGGICVLFYVFRRIKHSPISKGVAYIRRWCMSVSRR